MEALLFVAKQVMLRLIFPLSVSLILATAALILWRRRGLAFLLLLGSVLLLLIMSVPLTGLVLIRSLESQAGPYADPTALSTKGVRYVVVLSGGFRNGDISSTDRLGCSILRLLEGVALWRRVPEAKLVLTGGIIPGLNEDMSLATALANVSIEMGVPRNALVLESRSWTTEEQARLVAAIVGKEPFALVTSAYHMPRSLMLFRQQGLDPVPAPADFIARKIIWGPDTWMPQASGLQLTQIAAKEYLGMWLQAAGHRLSGK
jgi:uncharacterized SAM-binding protein YcdF (DUF218 family)